MIIQYTETHTMPCYTDYLEVSRFPNQANIAFMTVRLGLVTMFFPQGVARLVLCDLCMKTMKISATHRFGVSQVGDRLRHPIVHIPSVLSRRDICIEGWIVIRLDSPRQIILQYCRIMIMRQLTRDTNDTRISWSSGPLSSNLNRLKLP